MNTSPDLPGLDEERTGKPLDAKTVDDPANRPSPASSLKKAGDEEDYVDERDSPLQRMLREVLDHSSD